MEKRSGKIFEVASRYRSKIKRTVFPSFGYMSDEIEINVLNHLENIIANKDFQQCDTAEFGALAGKAIRNKIIDICKLSKKRQSKEVLERYLDRKQDINKTDEFVDEKLDIDTMLSRLPQLDQIIYLLHFRSSMSVAEISQYLSLSPFYVRTAICFLKKTVKDYFEK
jgi:DNA-directed RNA polymerase specialized sigma24 family protein